MPSNKVVLVLAIRPPRPSTFYWPEDGPQKIQSRQTFATDWIDLDGEEGKP